jgi:hypothetical protein
LVIIGILVVLSLFPGEFFSQPGQFGLQFTDGFNCQLFSEGYFAGCIALFKGYPFIASIHADVAGVVIQLAELQPVHTALYFDPFAGRNCPGFADFRQWGFAGYVIGIFYGGSGYYDGICSCTPAALKSSLDKQVIAPAGILFGATSKQAAKQQ